MKLFIEWLEENPTRARKFSLISTLFFYFFIVLILVLFDALGVKLSHIEIYFLSISSLAATVIGFYTATKAASD